MSVTVQPIVITPRLDRVADFYIGVFGAAEFVRVPEEGTIFFLGLRLGDSEIGIVADDAADLEAPQRSLWSIEVDDVDAMLERVEEFGGRVLGPANDMPWGQRVAHIQDPDGNAVNLTRSLDP